jgi:hypothetical protein
VDGMGLGRRVGGSRAAFAHATLQRRLTQRAGHEGFGVGSVEAPALFEPLTSRPPSASSRCAETSGAHAHTHAHTHTQPLPLPPAPGPLRGLLERGSGGAEGGVGWGGGASATVRQAPRCPTADRCTHPAPGPPPPASLPSPPAKPRHGQPPADRLWAAGPDETPKPPPHTHTYTPSTRMRSLVEQTRTSGGNTGSGWWAGPVLRVPGRLPVPASGNFQPRVVKTWFRYVELPRPAKETGPVPGWIGWW